MTRTRHRRPWFRPGVVYGIDVDTHRRTGYVGKTRQRPWTRRIEQHRDEQPWGDTITTAWAIYESPRVSDFGLSCREWWHIRLRRTIHNDVWNRHNPRRITKQQAILARQRRDTTPVDESNAGREAVATVLLFSLAVLFLTCLLAVA